MFNIDAIKKLARITDRDEMIRAVANIPNEDLRPAFTFVMLDGIRASNGSSKAKSSLLR